MEEYAITGSIMISSNTTTGISNGYVYVDNMAKLYPMPELGDGITIKNERSKDMMGLYEVYIVETKTPKVLESDTVIAKNEERAKIKVAVRFGEYDSDYIEFFVRCIGQWESKKPKEVKIVKE